MKFTQIKARAEKRKGAAALNKLLPKVSNRGQLESLSDDRYLAMMTKVINQAGFSWKVIENKWPEIEEAFFKFDPSKLCLLSPEQWEGYLKDRRVVRNGQKIKALQENIFFLQEIILGIFSGGRIIWTMVTPVSSQVIEET